VNCVPAVSRESRLVQQRVHGVKCWQDAGQKINELTSTRKTLNMSQTPGTHSSYQALYSFSCALFKSVLLTRVHFVIIITEDL